MPCICIWPPYVYPHDYYATNVPIRNGDYAVEYGKTNIIFQIISTKRLL